MPNVSSIVKQLKKERDRVAKKLSGVDAAIRAFANVYDGKSEARAQAAENERGYSKQNRSRTDTALGQIKELKADQVGKQQQ